ncbi:Acyl-CoA binding domain containing 5 [Haplosporangium sp. Z 27]|nr:Acyl-CoA binding domain containing 5 [Haplosporangium sp. Z 27]
MSYSSPRTSPPSSPISKAALRSRSPPLAPLPLLSATLPGLTAFDRAVHVVNMSNMTSQAYNSSSDAIEFTPEDQLLLYGAYKQATKGDVKGLKPTFFDISARSKWQAWANLRGKSVEEASNIYVDLVIKSLTKPGSNPEHIMLADEILQRPSTPPLLQQPEEPTNNATSITSDQHLQVHPRRKGSVSLSVGSGSRASAPSVYELARESLANGESEDTSAAADSPYHEFIETLVEEEIIDDDEYAAEVEKATSSRSPPGKVTTYGSIEQNNQAEHKSDDEEEDDEVYQSSEEYDEGDSDESSITHVSVLDPSSQTKETPQRPSQDIVTVTTRRHDNDDDFLDEGVFEEEEKDEELAQEQHLLGSPEPVEDINLTSDKEEEKILAKSPVSRHGSISSGYGGSVLSDKESSLSFSNTIDMLIGGQNRKSEINLTSPPVEPYRVNVMQHAPVSPLDLHDQNTSVSSQHAVTTPTATRHDTPAISSVQSSPVPVSANPIQTSQTSSSAPSTSLPSPSSSATAVPVDEPVCPVSKKTASSGGVCPAAMFAQARAAAANENGNPSTQASNTHNNNGTTSSAPSSTTIHQRSATLPVHSPPSESITPSSPPSATSTMTNQGKRIGQGIVSRFTAFKSSLAAVSARAASSALSSGSSSTPTIDPNAVVVKDPITNQTVTIVCPHLKSTQELESEVIRLQTDISVLHERLDILQESLKLKSESRALERRSVRGIVKLVLRQGLINAILLLIVFAVLYKRRSPIAFAILAYIGHSKKEGEAGWRAFMRWCADMFRTGQRNQQYMLRAGRRNGYW